MEFISRLKKTLLFLVVLTFSLPIKAHYEPTHASISTHSLPDWYQDAKFGVMIHYGVYTIPGYAPLFNPEGKVFTKEFFFNNPYAEWYFNTMQIPGSPTDYYHKAHWAGKTYDDFVPLFNEALKHWQPDTWADLFEKSGVKYVVFVTKHHDGFLLWPSQYPNPYKQNYMASRDVVGELTKAVRAHGMRMGLYYSGGYDWTWPSDYTGPITDIITAANKVPQSEAYAEYVNNQWHELVKNYQPDLLWNDIALPSKVDKYQFFADYYNTVPEGVMNNRFGQGQMDFTLLGQPADALLDLQLTYDWFDYYSPEYLTKYEYRRHKWEADHGPGYSFAYNRLEYTIHNHFMTLDELITDLADLVSKNGNLLLAIGPEADGTIPEIQRDLLLGIGKWLNLNGEAIYNSRAWWLTEGKAEPGNISIRYTQSKDFQHVYAILLKNPGGQDMTLQNLLLLPRTRIQVLNGNQPIDVNWYQVGPNVTVLLSKALRVPNEHAIVLKMTPDPILNH